jgi:hypothetical protein
MNTTKKRVTAPEGSPTPNETPTEKGDALLVTDRRDATIASIGVDPIVRISKKSQREYTMYKFNLIGENFDRYTFTNVAKVDANCKVIITPYLLEGEPVFTDNGIQIVNVEVQKLVEPTLSYEERQDIQFAMMKKHGIIPMLASK